MSLDSRKLSVESRSLLKPPLEEISRVLMMGLKNNFVDVNVEVVDCPDLTKEPFNLIKPGLGGNPRLLEVGGPPFLLPLYDKTKIYDLKDLVQLIGLNDAFVIGAGAGPWPHVGKNCEMMANVVISGAGVESGTNIAVLDHLEKDYKLDALPNSETRFCLLANLFCCSGLPGKVIMVRCKNRNGPDDFVTCMRKSLATKYNHQPVGLGGCFLLNSGKAKLHIMPSFSEVALDSDDKLNEWLKFFEMNSPLVAVGTLVSNDIPGLDLRVQHFHCMSNHNQGGHYHCDTTSSQAEYIGYFNIADYIYRVDKPSNTHMIGRD